jgi:hypothetical protein
MKNPSWFKKACKNDHESGSSRGIPPPPLPEHFVGQRRRVEDSPPRRDRRYVPLAECWEHWDAGIPISHHDVSLPGGWHLNFDRVLILPAPRVGTAALHEEMRAGAWVIAPEVFLCVVMTSPLGTPRGRYNEYSS